MKKYISLMVFGFILLFTGKSAFATTIIYAGGLSNGSLESGSTGKQNLQMSIYSVSFDVERFLVRYEVGLSNTTSLSEPELGYVITSNKDLKMYVSASQLDIYQDNTHKINQTVLGFWITPPQDADLTSANCVIGYIGEIYLGIAPNLNFWDFKFKYGYQFTKKFGAALHYRSYNINLDKMNTDLKFLSDMTLGLTYQF